MLNVTLSIFRVLFIELVVELILKYYCYSLLHYYYPITSREILKSGRGGEVEGGGSSSTHKLNQVDHESGVLVFGIFSIKLLIKFTISLIYRDTFYLFRGHFLPHSRTLLGLIKFPNSLAQAPKLPTSRTLFTYSL